MNDKKMLGNLLLLLTAMIWGTAFVFQRVGMDSIEPITFNAARMALAAVMVGALAFGLRQRKNKDVFPDGTAGLSAPAAADNAAANENVSEPTCSQTVTGGICCGLFLTAGSVFQQMGVVYTTAGKAGFITAMYMLLVPILNFLLFKKKNSWLVWLAVFIGVGAACADPEFTFVQKEKFLAGMAGRVFWGGRYVPVVCKRRFQSDPWRYAGLHLCADVQRSYFVLRLFRKTGQSH